MGVRKEKEKEKENSSRHIYSGILLIIIAILLFLSIVGGSYQLTYDYELLKSMELSFRNIFSLNFPLVENIIGPFGAFFGYWYHFLTGQVLAYFILLALFLSGLFKVFLKDNRDLQIKSLSLIFSGFFINLFLMSIYDPFGIESGIIVSSVFYVLQRIFSETGTAIISLALFISFVMAILGINYVKDLLQSLWKLLKSFATLFHSSDSATSAKKSKTADKQAKPRKNKIIEEYPLPREITAPKITNHVEYEDPPNDPESLSELTKGVVGKNEESISAVTSSTEIRPGSKRKKQIRPNDLTQQQDDEYRVPKIEEFLTSTAKIMIRDREEMETTITTTSRILIEKLAQFGIDAEVVNVNIGPIITQYELKPAPNIKVSRFLSLTDDLALAIKAKSIRVQAPIPGRGLIGIEVPNKHRETIYLKDVLLSEPMERSNSKLAIALGKDIVGTPVVADLAKMPHLLIAGSTNSGKSVCINSIICNLLFRSTPEELRMILIDPKRVELSGYEGIPHLIQDIVSDSEDALVVLNWAVAEMERRYELLQHYNVRDITGFNRKIKEMTAASEQEEFSEETLPIIIIIIDEFADLMMRAGREIEVPITRLAQMARAIGIHLILATQRPSIKIITGLIKANFPARIAFQVAQKIDSRVILDMNGAENLLGMGDMLYVSPTKAVPERIHGAFVSDQEIENLVDYLRSQPKPEQKIEIMNSSVEGVEMVDYDDELFIEAAKLIVSADAASVSMLQRHFKIGYARAGRLIDMLEKARIIGKYAGSKSREVIASQEVMDAYNLN